MTAPSKETGGPAFPHMAKAQYQGLGGLVTEQITDNGMTLRDYFAGEALKGWIASSPINNVTGQTIGYNDAESIAGIAYHYADAMLAERAK